MSEQGYQERATSGRIGGLVGGNANATPMMCHLEAVKTCLSKLATLHENLTAFESRIHDSPSPPTTDKVKQGYSGPLSQMLEQLALGLESASERVCCLNNEF